MVDYTTWHLGQLRFLLKVAQSSNNIVLAVSKSEGGSAKELRRKGYIVPFGKVGRSIRWKLAKPISTEEIKQLKKLVVEL